MEEKQARKQQTRKQQTRKQIVPYLLAGALAVFSNANSTHPDSAGNRLESIVEGEEAAENDDPDGPLLGPIRRVVHLDYQTLDFRQYRLDPLDGELLSALDSYRQNEIDSVMIPESLKDAWISEALAFKDDIDAQSYLKEKIRHFSEEKNQSQKSQSQLDNFNSGLLGSLNRVFDSKYRRRYRHFSELSIKDSLELVFQTTKERLDHREVDGGGFKLRGINYNEHAFDAQVSSGVGDCNVFASLAGHLFELLKKENRRLEKIYVGWSHFGRPHGHIWTQIYFAEGETLFVSSVDLSREKEKNEINNAEYPYLSELYSENLLPFYRLILSHRNWQRLEPLFQAAYQEAADYHRRKGDEADFRRRLAQDKLIVDLTSAGGKLIAGLAWE